MTYEEIVEETRTDLARGGWKRVDDIRDEFIDLMVGGGMTDESAEHEFDALIRTYERGIIHPQYDEVGFDTGMWRVFAYDADGLEILEYENICLGIPGYGRLSVGQCPDWYGEYDENGYIPDEFFVPMGTIQCPNPFMDEDASSILLNYLDSCKEAQRIW